jgi:hypothetical protein
MLRPDQIELIQREIDGLNTPEESARFRSLMAVDPPPYLRRAILESLPKNATSLRSQRRLITEAFMTRKTLIYAGAVVAIVILGASFVTGFPPLGGVSGTIGGDPPGVQQAARYHGRTMTAADVTLDNPEVKALLQNDQVLRLVKSDVFREVMNNAAFRELQASAAFRELQSSEAYRNLMSSEAFRDLQANAAYRDLMSSEAARDLQSNAAYRELMSNAAYRDLQANASFRELQSSAAYRELMSSAAYRELMSSEAYRELSAQDAFRDLQSNELFRAVSRDAQMSEAFMSAAMRAEQ